METKQILEAIAELSKQLHGSTEKKELFSSLAKAQAEFEIADLNKSNPYFKSKYADMQSIVSASRPALTKNGLSVLQQIVITDDGGSRLHTILAHTSGQSMESVVRINPPKNDIQSLSSYTTYMKRMCYASLVGVVTGDEDDDGEIAVAPTRVSIEKGTAINTKYDAKDQSYQTISKDQLAEIEYELAEYPDIGEQVLEGLKLLSLADMPASKYRVSVERIRSIKNSRNGLK